MTDPDSPSSAPDGTERSPESPSGVGSGLHRAKVVLGRVDGSPAVVRVVRSARRAAPGDLDLDRDHGMPRRLSDRLARLIGGSSAESPSALRELGLTAVQIWQSLAERSSGGSTEVAEVTILFTDLVGFSSWALRVGDDHAVDLLRQVTDTTTAIVVDRRGRVVKSLGDGLMAVFLDGSDAIEAAHEAAVAVSAMTVAGWRPALRAGLHTGRPRRDGTDYLGVDVNIAARVADAGAGERCWPPPPRWRPPIPRNTCDGASVFGPKARRATLRCSPWSRATNSAEPAQEFIAVRQVLR
ncbi:adenylate/guanylate cyclase domain-containing protein [Williamsia sp. CHRR-6]|uniref:adenylate/guanylate cyclase domain-containing protein n=1 Tax=Williamsia sp. CHRR-6 TaxID=2835871 RepID=UPI0027DB322C|nr:adenylate/guanylate cyclase domain-containing protein [Williamsia sp. CHRR-6]